MRLSVSAGLPVLKKAWIFKKLLRSKERQWTRVWGDLNWNPGMFSLSLVLSSNGIDRYEKSNSYGPCIAMGKGNVGNPGIGELLTTERVFSLGTGLHYRECFLLINGSAYKSFCILLSEHVTMHNCSMRLCCCVYWVMPWLHVKWNYFSLRQRPSEIILLQRVETCLKLFQRLFQCVQCCWNKLEIQNSFSD